MTLAIFFSVKSDFRLASVVLVMYKENIDSKETTMTNTNYSFLTLTTSNKFFSNDLIAVIDADEETTRAALVAAGLPEWSPGNHDHRFIMLNSISDIESYFNDKDDWFDDNDIEDFSTPWAFAAAAGDATGNDFAGAFTLAALVDHLVNGSYPVEAA